MNNTNSLGSNLTDEQISGNQKYYDGKYIKNWRLKVDNVTSRKIKLMIWYRGYWQNWLHIKRENIKKGEEKISSFRRGSLFHIKSGKIKNGFISFSLEEVYLY